MPDGRKHARHGRHRSDSKNTSYLPVVAHSAAPDNEVPCLEAGADEFLLKPRPAVELKRTLEDFSVKQMILYLEGESLSMRQVGPADSEELTELRMLNKKGMTKFTAVDIFSVFWRIKMRRINCLKILAKTIFGLPKYWIVLTRGTM